MTLRIVLYADRGHFRNRLCYGLVVRSDLELAAFC